MMWPAGAFQSMYQYEVAANGLNASYLPWLYGLAVGINSQQVIELGVREAGSTTAFLAALELTGGHLWSCDKDMPVQRGAELVNRVPWWEFWRMPDQQALELAPTSCDILFVDTSHTYDQTLWELLSYGPLVRVGGYVLMHDTAMVSVQQARDEWLATHDKWQGFELGCEHGLGVYWRLPEGE